MRADSPEGYVSNRKGGAWTGARRWGDRRAAATASRGIRAMRRGEPKPAAGGISHRQQARNNAISTGGSRFSAASF